jgi:hypothetical protein
VREKKKSISNLPPPAFLLPVPCRTSLLASSSKLSVNYTATFLKMCHGHPRYHACAHTSLIWYYCPSAKIDLETGYETPCRNATFAPAQSSSLSCPLKNCQFADKGGSWVCCKCNQGPNTQGWCSTPMTDIQDDLDALSLGGDQRTCDHGCCDDCKRFGKLVDIESNPAGANVYIIGPSRSPSPEKRVVETRKGRSRKYAYGTSSRSHRCESPYALMKGLSLDKSSESGSTAASASSSSSSSYDYRSKKSKPSKKNHKSKSRN